MPQLNGPTVAVPASVPRDERLAAWLHRLRDASAALARVFDRDAIERELARGAVRIVDGQGAVVARQIRKDGTVDVAVHWQGGGIAIDPVPDEVNEALAAVFRTGRSATAGDAPSAVIAVPVRTGHRPGGALAVYGLCGEYATDVTDLVATLAATAAAVLETAAVVNDSIRDKRQSEALAELARALGTSHRLGEVLHLGLRHSAAILGAEGADIMLVRGNHLHIVAASGRSAPTQGLYVPITESAAGRAMLEGRTLVVNHITAETRVNPTVQAVGGVTKFISVPLRTLNGPIGVLSVVNRDRDFNDADVRVLERLGSQLAVAVVQVRLFEGADDATRELRAAFDATAAGMAVVDFDGFIVRHNARLAALRGDPDDTDLVGQSLYDVILGKAVSPSEAEPIGMAILRRSVGRGLMHPHHGDRVFEVVASPHPNGGAVVTVDDITSFLSLSERYRVVVDSTTDAILITDGAGEITFANDAAGALFGRPVAGAGLLLSAFVPDEFRAIVVDGIGRALGGEALRLEAEVLRGESEERRVVSASLSPVRSGGRVTGVVASLRDGTEERALLQRVARHDKLAALGELVGGVAHEVNSPLTGILMHAQLLQMDAPADDDTRVAIDTIVNEARRAARIVGKLLTFARQNPSERVPTEINQVVLDTIELRRYPLRMQGVHLDVVLAEGLPEVSADPFQLQQVLINLLSNAEQAAISHQTAGPRITVRSELRGTDLVVSVTDNGNGIAPEHLPHIFNPFYTTKPHGVGTGLGLSISFGIMREHGGFIQAHSQPGRGATFTVVLPVRDSRASVKVG